MAVRSELSSECYHRNIIQIGKICCVPFASPFFNVIMPLVINPPHAGITAWHKGMAAVNVTVLLDKKHLHFNKEIFKSYFLDDYPFHDAGLAILVFFADGYDFVGGEDVVGIAHHEGLVPQQLPYQVFDILDILLLNLRLFKVPEKIDFYLFHFFHILTVSVCFAIVREGCDR